MKFKNRLLSMGLTVGVFLIPMIETDTMTIREKDQLCENIKQEWHVSNAMETMIDIKEKEQEQEKRIQAKVEEIALFKRSEEYQKREKIYELEKKYNIPIKDIVPITWEVSFYSDLACENSKHGPVNSQGERLENGMIANNHFDIGQKVEIEGIGLREVRDRGSSKYFSKSNAIDVFIPRNDGESDSQYYKRVNNLGRHNIDGYILIEKGIDVN